MQTTSCFCAAAERDRESDEGKAPAETSAKKKMVDGAGRSQRLWTMPLGVDEEERNKNGGEGWGGGGASHAGALLPGAVPATLTRSP
uniref:Uncharacterized protein n=1 Tax=Oryza sativa subsp. japonica TaxID=39947 RepID=Q658G5_ORYSJ|nr:hypothetical protein [Oryza sativa Japonica Group]BAD67665.1 hypothetical protein [Oryza sativa Japonica Group]